MARVNVEQKALTDPRFRALGSLLKSLETLERPLIEQACGLLLSIRVWDQCQERGSDTLPAYLVESIQEGLVAALVAAELAEWTGETGANMVRIKGAHERCLWLAGCRSAGRSGGKLGGRPTKPLGDNVLETPGGTSQKTPPAPTPALAQQQKKQPLSNGKPVGRDTDRWSSYFPSQFWPRYPRREGKQSAMKAWMALRPKKQDREQDTAELICTALEARKVEWADRDQKFIPLPATWLRRESFEESEVLGGTA